jgi:type I restriction enzyme S subunit
MSAGQLVARFDRISAAPDAIPQLRRFVLDLSVRGKLVQQDPRDEPAEELLTRIRARREVLLRTKEIKPARANYGPIAVGEDFALPPGWVRSTINETCDLQTGATPDRTRSEYFGGDIRWLVSGDINQVEIRECEGRITQLGLDKSNCKILPPDSVMMALNGQGKTRATVALLRVPAACNQSLVAIIPLLRDCLVPEYLFWNLRSRYHAMRHLTGQDERRGLNMKLISCFEISIPPVAEQHRIVARANELMALCNRLEAAREECETRRDRLTAASLHHLCANGNGENFRASARFYINHLTDLIATPKQIAALRENILTLAIRGELVRQNSEEQPVSELLKSIVAENANLQKSKGIRPQKSAPPAENFETETVIPPTWAHAYLQDLAYQITDGTHLTPKYTDEGRPFLSAQNVKPFRFMPDKHRLVSKADFENYRSNRRPERGDVLLTRVGAGIGEAAVLDSDFEFAFYVSLCLIKIPTNFLNPKYLVLWLNSPEGRGSSTLRTYGKGASQGNLNLGLIRTFKVPLPPLAEQHRIVAKVEELMALCSRLEAQLTTVQTESSRLLESVLHNALSDTLQRAAMVSPSLSKDAMSLQESR